jgi:hypothetical protein
MLKARHGTDVDRFRGNRSSRFGALPALSRFFVDGTLLSEELRPALASGSTAGAIAT